MTWQIDDNPFASCKNFAGTSIHLGICGSVACYKAAELLRAFLKIGLHVSATLTAGAKYFVTPLLFRSLGAEPVYGEMFEDEKDVFAHLLPGKKAALLAVVPASANFLARVANGAASDMLSAQSLAFDDGPVVIAPAMNPKMWQNKATQENIEKLLSRGYVMVPPANGEAACGDQGHGRLAELPAIFLEILRRLSPQDMTGCNVLATLGPTREYWDDVRFWSNSSSGKMGCALATAAWLRGANVTAICGPCPDIYMPEGITLINVNSGREMFEAARSIWPKYDLGLFCAAVSDFYPLPEENGIGKIHREDKESHFGISFGVNADIMASLCGEKSPSQKALGFAAEIAPDLEGLLPCAKKKLSRKNADLIAANRINPGDSAFGANENSVLVLDRHGHVEIWKNESKADIAWNLMTWLLNI